MAAAVNLQSDAGLMLSNLQILSQFVTSLHRTSSEMMSIGIGRVVFPAKEIADLSSTPRVPRAAKYTLFQCLISCRFLLVGRMLHSYQ